MPRATFRLLRALREAGIEFDYHFRVGLKQFLEEGLRTNSEREEWLRKAIFAARAPWVEHPGRYVSRLAAGHVHAILEGEELRRYERARAAGFGTSTWDRAVSEPDGGAA